MRHVLFDFGSTGLPAGTGEGYLLEVAQDIQQQCGGKNGKLDVIVATHRHKDHISGFARNEAGNGPGDIIRMLAPELVIQPWTEDPDAARDATKLRGLSAAAERPENPQAAFMKTLLEMHTFAEITGEEAAHLADRQKFKQLLDVEVRQQIQFLADDNKVPNASAVKNLATMGKKAVYVNYGSDLDLSKILPGVTAKVLGPPTIDQYAEVQKERSRDNEEFWMLQAVTQSFWGLQAATGEALQAMIQGKAPLFPEAECYRESVPVQMRWIVRRMRALRGEQLLQLVRIMDQAMNNTSVILVLEVGKKKFLFPGDAQIENWEYALKFAKDHEENLTLLKEIDLYKVGHHGSRNATPKTLWNDFQKKSAEAANPDRLNTINSTMGKNERGEYKHGSEENNSEVPRRDLVKELKKMSNYHTTEETVKDNKLFIELEFEL